MAKHDIIFKNANRTSKQPQIYPKRLRKINPFTLGVHKNDTITFHGPEFGDIKIFIRPGVLTNTIPGNPEEIYVPRSVKGKPSVSKHDVILNVQNGTSTKEVKKTEIIYAVYCVHTHDWVTGNSYPRIIIEP